MAIPVTVWNTATTFSSTYPGTLTGVVRSRSDPSMYFAMGSSHVLAPPPEGGNTFDLLGSEIWCQPQGEAAFMLGVLDTWADLVVGELANERDAALVKISADTASRLVRLQPKFVAPAAAREGDGCSFLGAASAIEGKGTVETRFEATEVRCRSAYGSERNPVMANMTRALMKATGGDSGSLILNGDASPIGMLTATMDHSDECLFYDIQDALDYFDVDLVARVDATETPLRARVVNPDAERGHDILARTLWGEARNQPMNGIRAVASVILNRMHKPTPQLGVVAVCQRPRQFSCWNANDPNLPKLLAVDQGDAAFRACLAVTDDALNGTLADLTKGATHYHTRAIHPDWATKPCAEIGDHLFYNDIR